MFRISSGDINFLPEITADNFTPASSLGCTQKIFGELNQYKLDMNFAFSLVGKSVV